MEEDMASRSHPYADAPSAPLKPSEVLEKAAALIEPGGRWIQEDYCSGGQWSVAGARLHSPCFCVLGALAVSDPRMDSWWDAEEGEAAKFLQRALGERGAHLVARWNDAPERTQPEVVAALRKAAELARSEGQ